MSEWITAIIEAIGLYILGSVVICLVAGRVFKISEVSISEEDEP
jgi:hypothetical protein